MGAAGVVGCASQARSNESTTAILSQQLATHRIIEEVKGELMAELCRISSQFSRQLRNIHGAVKRIALQPVVRARVWTSTARRGDHTDRNTGENNNTDDDNDTDIDFLRNIEDRAVLYKGIKNLFDLWQEYEFGLSGNKPAKDFTRLERGKHKYAYCRRKVFWEIIIKLVNTGHISDT